MKSSMKLIASILIIFSSCLFGRTNSEEIQESDSSEIFQTDPSDSFESTIDDVAITTHLPNLDTIEYTSSAINSDAERSDIETTESQNVETLEENEEEGKSDETAVTSLVEKEAVDIRRKNESRLEGKEEMSGLGLEDVKPEEMSGLGLEGVKPEETDDSSESEEEKVEEDKTAMSGDGPEQEEDESDVRNRKQNRRQQRRKDRRREEKTKRRNSRKEMRRNRDEEKESVADDVIETGNGRVERDAAVSDGRHPQDEWLRVAEWTNYHPAQVRF